MVRLIGSIGFVVATAGATLFAFMFLFAVKWWTDTLGRVIAATFAVIALIMILASMVIFGVELPYVDWWRAVMYPALAIAMWRALWVFVKTQFRARRRASVPSGRQQDSAREGVK